MSSLKAKLGSIQKVAEKRILRLERALPILVDFAEDRVYFRGLNIALFALVLLFIIRAGLFIVFLQFPLVQKTNQALNLEGKLGPNVYFGGSFDDPVKVHVTKTSRRIPVIGRNISLKIELALPDLLKLTNGNGFENTITHLSGIALKGSFSIPGFPPKVLEIPKLSGSSELTDINGDAIFRKLRINTGVPGAYVITAIDTIDGRETKIGKVQIRTQVTNAIIIEDGRQKLGYGRRGLPPRIITGEPLPVLKVKVTNSNKIGIPGKMCVLTSASRESSEFSNVGARPDVFHPRLVVINNPYSTLTDEQGFAEFRNVTLSTTIKHIRLWIVCDGRVASYEGSKDRSLIFTGIRKNSQTHTLIATISQQPSTDVLEGEILSRQPSLLLQYRSITTGQLTPATGITVFAYPFMQAGFKSRNIMSPAGAAELEMLRESEQAILGNLGRVKQLFNLISLPSDEKGFANFTNLGFIRHGEAGEYTLGFDSTGIFDELESNVIKVKTSVHEVLWTGSSVFDDQRYIKMASDVLGLSTCQIISKQIIFSTEKLKVCPELPFPEGQGNQSFSSPPNRVASAVCNWPICRTNWGSSSGFVMYNSSVDISTHRTSVPTFRSSPSGVLSSPPILYIADKYGRKLAGKSAKPITSSNVEIFEVPFKGASVSKLSAVQPNSFTQSQRNLLFGDFSILSYLELVPSILTQTSPRASQLSFHRENIAPISDSTSELAADKYDRLDRNDFLSESRQIGDQGSFFRVVSAPRGTTQTILAFEVEGIRTNSTVLEVFNIDSDTAGLPLPSYAPPVASLCAHIRILQSPNQLRQDGSVNTDVQDSTMSLLFLDQVGNEKPFIVQAINSFGESVQVDGIGMYAVDALGYVMVTSVGGEHVGLSSSYTSSLRSLGAATLTIGNYSSMTILREHMLAPIILQNTNSTGHALFNLTRIRRAQNTWVKFAFVALYADIKAKFLGETDLSVNDFYDGPASCVSEFSSPVSIDSVVSSIEWEIPSDSSRQYEAIGSALNSTTFAPLPALPNIRVVASKWAEKLISSGSSFPFVTALGETDNIFESTPAHVAVTARTFVRNTSTIEYWSAILDLYLPQLENAIIPFSLSRSSNVDDIYQVASISSSISSTLGLQLLRWTTSIEDDLNSTFAQIASRPSRIIQDSSGSVSTIATLPRISSSRGNVGVYNFVAFSGGVSGSESVQVNYKDDINALILLDHSATLSGLCPPRSYLEGKMLPQRDEVACQGFPACSGHGECVCGICICIDGYDGSEDCSVKYERDDFGEYFSGTDSNDHYYKGKYIGLPVYDSLKAMITSFNDSFPQIIFPALIGVGKFVDLSSFNGPILVDFINDFDKAIKYDSAAKGVKLPPIPILARVNDTGNDAWVYSSSLKELLPVASQNELENNGFYDGFNYAGYQLKQSFTLANGSSGYRAFPILYTCAGDEVQGWWFSPSWSRCSYDQIQVFADSYFDTNKNSFLQTNFNTTLPSGTLSFNHYNLKSFDKFNSIIDDLRLFLGGVKSGCYRFKWAYAPQGSGDRQYRRLDDPLHQSQVISLGFSRPFRVLGVVHSMNFGRVFLNEPETLPRDKEIKSSIDVYLLVRKTVSVDKLKNFCYDNVPTNFDVARSPYRRFAPSTTTLRCKVNDFGISSRKTETSGLDVTVSAVNIETKLEYSLYVPSKTFDCSQAIPSTFTNPGEKDFTLYKADFSGIQFPSVVNIPPGPDSQFYTEASEIPVGKYRLKFRAYGEELMTPESYVLTLVDEPTKLSSSSTDDDIRNFPNYFSNSSIPGVSKACYDRSYEDTPVCGDPLYSFKFCFPSDCNLRDDYYYSTIIGSNITCLQECTKHFRSELTSNIVNVTKKTTVFRFNVSETVKGNQLYPKWSSDPLIPGTLVEAAIVYSPPRSNARLSPVSSSSLTVSRKSEFSEEKVYAEFSSLLFESGISGLYILRFSVNTKVPVDPGFLLFDVHNPIQEVKVTINDAPLSRISSSYASAGSAIRLIESSKLSQTIRVCIVPSSGRTIQSLFPSNTVITRLLSDPTPISNSQTILKAPTKTGDGRAWKEFLNSLVGNRQQFIYAENGADEDRYEVVTGFIAFTKSISNSSRTSIDPRTKGTPLGSDGCVEFSDLSLNTIGYTQRIAVVFSVLGVEGPPLILDLVTLLDANPVSTESLQNQIIIPLVIMMPAFGANSQFIDFKLRCICLISSFIGLSILASTSGIQFLNTLADFYKAFSAEDVQYVLILSVAFWIMYSIVLAYLFGLMITLARVFYKSFKNRSFTSFRDRKASSSFLSETETTHVFDMTRKSGKKSQKFLSSFFETHMLASIAYTRRLLPRFRVSHLLEDMNNSNNKEEDSRLLNKSRSVFATLKTSSLGKKLEKKPSLKERIQQTLRYVSLCLSSFFTSFESSHDAFFYPQRLILTALVSLICCLLFAALFVYGCSHLSDFAKAALDDFFSRETAAIQTAKLKVLLALDETKLTLSSELSKLDTALVGTATSPLAQGYFQEAVSSVLDQIIFESEMSNFGFAIPSIIASQLRSVSNNTLLQSEDPAAEIIRAQRSIVEPWIEATNKNLRSSVSFGLSVAAFIVTIIWIDFLMVYKRVILAIRRGNVQALPSYFNWVPDRAVVSTAPTFIGIQSIGTMLSYVIFSVIFTLLSFLLSAKIVQEFLVNKALSFIGLTALGTILINFFRIALLKHIATSKGNISLRALFSFLDIYFMFFNILTGAAVALVRFTILIPFYFILVMRPDIQVLPRDPATSSYCSVVLLDSRYNNPIGKVANEIFRKILQEVRQKRLETKRSSRDLRSIVLNPMTVINSQKNITEREISTGSLTSSSSLIKSKRIVNRWWLYAMLATHPVLCKYRHKEEIDNEEEDDNDNEDEKVKTGNTEDETKKKKKSGDDDEDKNKTITVQDISVTAQDTHDVSSPPIGIITIPNTETIHESIITKQTTDLNSIDNVTRNINHPINHTDEKVLEDDVTLSNQSRKSRIQLASNKIVKR
jgi:hypothetical protein